MQFTQSGKFKKQLIFLSLILLLLAFAFTKYVSSQAPSTLLTEAQQNALYNSLFAVPGASTNASTASDVENIISEVSNQRLVLSEVPNTESKDGSYDAMRDSGLFGDEEEISVGFFSKESSPAGSTVKILGTGFDTNTQIIFGDLTLSSEFISKNEISFTIPYTALPGVYDVEAKNHLGTSESPLFFPVTRLGAIKPVVTSVYPSVANIGDEITLTGENFSPEGNVVFYTFNRAYNIPSLDGRTLKFILNAPDDAPEMEKMFSVYKEIKVTLPVFVANENGISDRAKPAIIELN
jgi:hypothetical protein